MVQWVIPLPERLTEKWKNNVDIVHTSIIIDLNDICKFTPESNKKSIVIYERALN